MEKMKHWNWKLIFHILAAIGFLIVYLVIGIGFNNSPELQPFLEDGYKPTPECLYGFGIAISAVCFGHFAYNVMSTLDLVFPPKKGEKDHA